MSSLSLRLPDSLHKAVKDLARKEHVSINQLITLALTEKLSVLSTESYLQERAKRGSRDKYLNVLNRVSDVPADSNDTLD